MMLQQILSGQARPFVLFSVALMIFLYLLPAILAFTRAHRHFFYILVANLLLSPIQSAVAALIAPNHVLANAANPLLALLINFGPGWIALIVWALRPGAPNARLVAAQNTKLYDAIAALPLILWFGYGAWQLRPVLVNDLRVMLSGQATLFAFVQFFSLAAAAGFDLLLVWLLIVRDKPVRKSKGVLPRFCGFAGTFLGVGILQLPVAQLSLGMQLLSAVLVGVGSLGSLLVLSRLGKAFSIMPEARMLVTTGPYAHARHPLYAVEIISVAGTALLFQQPWAALIAVGVVVLLIVRSLFEEQVLSEAYPEYTAYRARTKRFVPGVI